MGGNAPKKVDTSYQDWSIEEAGKARAEEEARQNRVKLGMDQIRTIFEGGKTKGTPTAAAGAYNPNQTYYNADGSVWKPTAQKTTTKTTKTPVPAAAAARAAKPVRNASKTPLRANGLALMFSTPVTDKNGKRVVPPSMKYKTRSTTSTTGLTPEQQYAKALKDLKVVGAGKSYAGVDPILDARRKAQEGFYLPQLDEQRDEAQEELTYALSRAGQLVSTTAGSKRSKLDEGFNRERAGVMADIDRDVAGAAGDYESQRQALEAQLRSSGDASAATAAGLRSIATFAKDTPELRPLENALLGLTTGIGGMKNAYDIGAIRQRAQGGSTVNRDLSRNVG